MRDRGDRLFYLSAGPLAAIALGVALMPMRETTTASNLSFAFMALTLIAAELGGKGPALGTAVVSALSLDFFLTEPYLHLAIADKQDVAAFVGLAVCGLLVASLAARRNARIASLAEAWKHRELLHAVLRGWHPALPLAPQLDRVLRAACDVLPLEAAVVRDADGAVVAASSEEAARRPLPPYTLDPETAAPPGPRTPWTAPFPDEGGRLPLEAGSHPRAWLEVWGDGTAAGLESRRAMADVARVVAVLLGAGRARGAAAPARTATADGGAVRD
jgi:hypothetical protein